MQDPPSVRANQTQKLLRDFEIQTDHLISARRPSRCNNQQKKRTCRMVDVVFSADETVKLK